MVGTDAAADRPRLARSSESAGSGGFASAGGEGREEPLDVLTLAFRADQITIGVVHPAQEFKPVAALFAAIFVQGHGVFNYQDAGFAGW